MNKLKYTLILLVFTTSLLGQDLSQVDRSASNSHEHFGWDMALTDQWMVVGSPHSTTGAGEDAGKVLIYQKIDGQWVEFQTLIDPDGNAFYNYGFSIDMSENQIVIGAIGSFNFGPFSGEVFVYSLDQGQWVLNQILVASDGSAGDHFGHDVAIANNRIVVGSLYGNGQADESGAAYVFENVEGVWTEREKLVAADGALNDNFGFSVDVSDQGKVLIGAPNHSGIHEMDGAAYLFEDGGDGYLQSAILKQNEPSRRDYFGTSVALTEDDILVGAFLADGFSNNTGAAYFFNKVNGDWTQVQKLANEDSELNDYFARYLTMTNDRLLIGAPKANAESGYDVGRAYYYEISNGRWILNQVLEDPDGSEHNYFGSSVALSSFGLGISARMHDGEAYDGGAVYTSTLGRVTSNESKINLERSISLINYPNPAPEEIRIQFELLGPAAVSINIFDSNAKPVKVLLSESMLDAGKQEFIWDLRSSSGQQVANGIYLYRLTIDGNTITRKLIVNQ